MLYKILPEKINKDWDYYASFIANSLPPTIGKSYRNMVNVLEAILLEKLVCWGYYDEEGNLLFLLTTTFQYDEVSKNRRLVIYTLTAVAKINSSMFLTTIEALRKYARTNVCTSIIAFTKNDRLLTYLKRMDANVDFNLIELEVV